MALVKCKECAQAISKSAKTCPHCGYKKKETSVFKILIAVFALFCFYSYYTAKPSLTPPTPKQPPSAEDLANSERFAKVQLYGTALKQTLREPDSIQWLLIKTNDDASVACFKYSGRNGFGGVSIEYTAVVNDLAIAGGEAWNKHCVGKSMHDMTRVKGDIR